MSEDDEELDKDTIGRKAIEELSAEKLTEYREIFSFFDRDGGGSIGAEEFQQVMRTFGWDPREDELKDMVSVIDQDGDGDINFNEFVWLMTREFHDSDIEEEIREAFRVFDKEGNGFISTAELAAVMMNIGEVLSQEETEELVAEADIDGDGNVNYEEFVAMIFREGCSLFGKKDQDRESRNKAEKAD